MEPQIQAYVPNVQLKPKTVIPVLGNREGLIWFGHSEKTGEQISHICLVTEMRQGTFMGLGNKRGIREGISGSWNGKSGLLLVSDNTLNNQTSGHQQQVATFSEAFILPVKQTHRFSLWPWSYLFLLDKETVYQQLIIAVKTRNVEQEASN